MPQKIAHKFVTLLGLILLVVQIKAQENDKEEDIWGFLSVKFVRGFTASFMAILVSEIGDKTFFIAAIMSMKYSRLAVFGGAISSLIIMTVLSAAFGLVFLKFIPPTITRWVSVALFAIFGLKMLYEGWKMSPADAVEEMNEVQSDLGKRETERNKDPESVSPKPLSNNTFMIFVRIFMQAFTMTFVAEWGDRSQITTIVLAARENLWGVISGGVLGHSICTGLAVIGGRLLAAKISIRTITIIGGIVFIAFAITSSIWDPTAEAQELQEGKTIYIQNKLERFGLY